MGRPFSPEREGTLRRRRYSPGQTLSLFRYASLNAAPKPHLRASSKIPATQSRDTFAAETEHPEFASHEPAAGHHPECALKELSVFSLT
jgi:hypothetical protein